MSATRWFDSNSLGVSVMGHWLEPAARRRIVARADALGFRVILLDGEAHAYPDRASTRAGDPTPVNLAERIATDHARIGTIQLPPLWRAADLARTFASQEAESAGGVIGFFGIGDAGRASARLTPEERVRWLDHELSELRQQLDLAGTRIPLMLAARGPRAMQLVDLHADLWDANVPPVAGRLEPARARLTRAIETCIWVFARPLCSFEEAHRDYRKVSPWFAGLSLEEARGAILWGNAERCRNRLSALRRELEIDLPVLDLAGLDEAQCLAAIELLAPAM